MKVLLLLVAFCLVLQGTFANTKDYVDINQVAGNFAATYVHTTALKDYIVGISVSTLEIQKVYHNITLTHNEDWTDACLDVMVGAPLPPYLTALLPASFLDVKVFYRVASGENVICPMIAKLCDDGTTASHVVINGKCELVCPQPIGGLSYDTMVDILQAYENEYFLASPYSDYISGLYISTISQQDSTRNTTLGPHENWEDYCLAVVLHSKSDLVYPKVYKGSRVFYSYGTHEYFGFDTVSSSSISIICFISGFLFVAFVIIGCRIRRRRCLMRQAQQKLAVSQQQQQQPMMMPYMPHDDQFAVEMAYPGMYSNDDGLPEPVMMVPNGYPVFVPQHGWFMPVPPEPQQQE
jgi:hypothetical protein